MSDLISREALTEYFEKHKRIAVHKDDIVAAICNAQTIDAVPLREYKALKAENEALKAKLDALTEDIFNNCRACGICKHLDEETTNYSDECKSCVWYPWNDEETVPCIWEWRGASNDRT